MVYVVPPKIHVIDRPPKIGKICFPTFMYVWSSSVPLYDNEEADLAVISIQYAYNAKLY